MKIHNFKLLPALAWHGNVLEDGSEGRKLQTVLGSIWSKGKAQKTCTMLEKMPFKAFSTSIITSGESPEDLAKLKEQCKRT